VLFTPDPVPTARITLKTDTRCIVVTKLKPEVPMPLDPTLRQAIDNIEWDKLGHAYGGAGNTPAALEQLASDNEEERNEAHDFLFYSAYHQGTVYSATVEIVPILTRMVATEGFPERHQLLYALHLMYNGTSYHDVHRGFTLMGDTTTQDYQQKVARELSWVEEIKKRIRASLPVYLPLLTAPEWEARLVTPLLLCSLTEDYDTIRPVAVAAFEKETHPLCRAGLLVLMGITGEPIRPRWDAGLKDDPALLMRVVAASRLVRQERENTPQEVIDTLMQVMVAPPPELVEEYQQIPTQGNLTADLGAALSFAGPAAIERVIDNLLTDLQKGPDVNLQRTSLLLQLTCILANSRQPFADPTVLNATEQRVVRECRRQLGLEVSPGFKLSGFLNFTDILQRFGLPSGEAPFDAYLAQIPT
jgi:hypothetical protein